MKFVLPMIHKKQSPPLSVFLDIKVVKLGENHENNNTVKLFTIFALRIEKKCWGKNTNQYLENINISSGCTILLTVAAQNHFKGGSFYTTLSISSTQRKRATESLLKGAKVTCYFSKCVAQNANQWFALTHQVPRTSP